MRMALPDYNFVFCSDSASFHREYDALLSSLIGLTVCRVHAVWNRIDNTWFLDAPMLIEFEQATLAIWTLGSGKIALNWNDINLEEKPKWFDEPPKELNWKEDLVWREYIDLQNKRVSGFQLLTESIGLIVAFDDGSSVGIVNYWDTTDAFTGEILEKYIANPFSVVR